MLKKFTICIEALIIFPLHSFAKEDLPVPRWVSLNAEANMRKGPSTNASIIYRYHLAGYPMEIIRQIDGWRYVRDPLTNTEGWMSHILFNGARFVITSNKDVNYGYKSANKNKLVAKLAYGVHGKILNCNSNWCYVAITDNEETNKLYIEKKNLYGVYSHEIID